MATIVPVPLVTLITSLSGMTGGWLVNTLLAPSHPYSGPMSTSLELSDGSLFEHDRYLSDFDFAHRMLLPSSR
jgi:hypothetical protein